MTWADAGKAYLWIVERHQAAAPILDASSIADQLKMAKVNGRTTRTQARMHIRNTRVRTYIRTAQDMAGLRHQGRALGRAGQDLDTVVAPASLVGSFSDVSL